MQGAGRPKYDDFPHRTYVLFGRMGCCFLDAWGVGEVKKKHTCVEAGGHCPRLESLPLHLIEEPQGPPLINTFILMLILIFTFTRAQDFSSSIKKSQTVNVGTLWTHVRPLVFLHCMNLQK